VDAAQKVALEAVVQTHPEIMPSLAVVAEVPRQILLVKRGLMEVPLYSVLVEEVLAEREAVVLVLMAEHGVLMRQA
tara:strand:- start:369 stop:596 length:228 start_codon:yes stop_codon:yes gene_type:complete